MTLADELSSGMVILDEEVYQEVTEVGCGECATAYSAVTMTGEAVVLKVFDAGKRASPMDSRSIYNHYGKTRDVSRQVFEEIRTKCAEHPFLLKFFRIAARESCWILIMERAMGIPLTEFIEINRSEPEVLSKASNELGKHLKEWHAAGFAHGDPHLANVMYDERMQRIRLVDLNMIHHLDFCCCKHIGCSFDHNNPKNRFKEDLENSDGKVGGGFLASLRAHDVAHNIGSTLADAFIAGYES